MNEEEQRCALRLLHNATAILNLYYSIDKKNGRDPAFDVVGLIDEIRDFARQLDENFKEVK
jgi:hypothetical protein